MRFIAYYDRPNLSVVRRLITPLSTLSARGHSAFFQLESTLKYIETANYQLIFLPNWSYRGQLPTAQGIYIYDLSDPELLKDDGVLNVIGQCHAVTVPSEGLAKVVRPFRAHVRILPTLVNAELFLRAQPFYPPAGNPEHEHDSFIGCFGDHDWEMIVKPLSVALKQLPSTVRVMTDSVLLRDALRDRVVYTELNPQLYPRLARTVFLGLLPRAKDDHDPVWALELGLCGVTCVGSPAYKDTILHNDTGFIAASSEQWSDLITRVYADYTLRSRIGQQAQSHARQFTVVRGADKWLKSIQKFLP